ncbi:MAG: ABC transporter permease [Candidatus Melainabacteria bacterium]|nr:ABC transporter permease [Candidatus Melainabacteria bacterium]
MAPKFQVSQVTAAVSERPTQESKPRVPGSRVSTVAAGSEAPTSLWGNRALIRLMVHRDFIGRYKGSLLGAFWPLINPIGHLVLYTFLFSVVLKVKFGASDSTGNFALYLMAGLLPWSCLAESLSRSTTVILESPNLVKRVVFPLQILPVVLVISSLMSELVAFTILFVAATITLHTVNPTILFLPLIVVSQILFTGGLSCLLASLGVYIRDIRHLMALGLSAWMYATPIVYPASALPANLQFLVWINPMAGIVTDYRRVLFGRSAICQ